MEIVLDKFHMVNPWHICKDVMSLENSASVNQIDRGKL